MTTPGDRKTDERIGVEAGEFPFPLTERTEESRYLVWLRNHSNYMAERGLLDWMRILAVYIRGICINFITLVPFLMVLALVVSLVYGDSLAHWQAEQTGWVPDLAASPSWWAPYNVTLTVIGAGLAWVLLFPILIRLSKIFSYRRSLTTGSSSSVKQRDLYERSFGGILLLLVLAVLIETLPVLAYVFHEATLDRANVAMTIVVLTTLLGFAHRVLSKFSGGKHVLAMLLIALFGQFVPLLFMLAIVDFLVFAQETSTPLAMLLLVLPIILAVGILLAIGVGLLRRVFRPVSYLVMGFFLVLMLGLMLLGLALGMSMLAPEQEGTARSLLFLHGESGLVGNYVLVALLAFEIWLFCWLTVDVNLTSIHGLYRDRLASAYLVGVDRNGDVDIEDDIDLADICQYETGSQAPYHLVNVALNLQSSKDIGIRDRKSDFFVFSKRFIGGERTGYCRSEDLEQVFSQMDLPTAMAISAAAAAPNMGRNTNPLTVAFLTLLNVRMGFWAPNPGRVHDWLSRKSSEGDGLQQEGAIDFASVFAEELGEIKDRRAQAYPVGSPERSRHDELDPSKGVPSCAHQLLGLGFSGGGIRSATINLGIAQVLDKLGVFRHADYMSTVSGGGYLGSSISTLMRFKTSPVSTVPGRVEIDESAPGEKIVRVTPAEGGEVVEHRFTDKARLSVETGQTVEGGARLLHRRESAWQGRTSLLVNFLWRVRPGAFVREMLMKLDERHKWVNLSDGGHLENLAGLELLRRRCRIVVIGDGEADQQLHFKGLATLLRTARVDHGIEVDINVDDLRLRPAADGNPRSGAHYAVGIIHYPAEPTRGLAKEEGLLLYLKSSFTGTENEVIHQYRDANPAFPHQTTADQFFDEGQFEAYRALGEHIARTALGPISGEGEITFAQLEAYLQQQAEREGRPGL